MIEGYETLLADSFASANQVNFNTLFEWLYTNSQLVKYGPWNGFGETIFNLMLSEADEREFVRNAVRMHCLGIEDKDYNKSLINFCKKQKKSLVKSKEWPMFFAMKGLAQDKSCDFREDLLKHSE